MATDHANAERRAAAIAALVAHRELTHWIREAHEAGVKVVDIAHHAGITRPTVYSRLGLTADA